MGLYQFNIWYLHRYLGRKQVNLIYDIFFSMSDKPTGLFAIFFCLICTELIAINIGNYITFEQFAFHLYFSLSKEVSEIYGTIILVRSYVRQSKKLQHSLSDSEQGKRRDLLVVTLSKGSRMLLRSRENGYYFLSVIMLNNYGV